MVPGHTFSPNDASQAASCCILPGAAYVVDVQTSTMGTKHQQRLVKEGCASKTFKQNIQNLKVQETAAAQGPAAFNLIIHESTFLANKFVNPFNIS